MAADRRPALDGLRGVAVAAVVAYHLGGGATSVLAGGYLGVDTFFVLSGYLITSLLLDEHAATGRIDLVAFWARRVRRLFPAAALVLLAVAGLAWFLGPVEAWGARRADLLWTLGYAANWHFVAVGEDYFAAYTGASPLRHAWSLAVEEQFYLVWPVLAGVVLARRRRLVAVVASVAILASAAAMWAEYSVAAPSRAYFGTDGRVQELAVGVLLAVAVRAWRSGTGRRGLRDAWPRWLPVSGPLGAVVLGAAYLLLPDASPFFYRGAALVVCLAVALVVADVELRPGAPLARALSWRPLVALGAISYGVYLWHWPVVVYLPTAGLDGGAWWARQVLRVAVTLAVSGLSYVLVEQPVRRGRVPWLRRSVPRLGVAAVLTAAVVAWASVAATAVPARYAAQIAEGSDHPCPGEVRDPLSSCVVVDGVASSGTPSAPPAAVRDVVTFGDSTARALDAGLRLWAQRSGGRYVQAAWQRCTPSGLLVLPLGASAPDSFGRECASRARERQRQVLDVERARGAHPLVLVADFWSHHQGFLLAGRFVAPGTAEHDQALRSAYTSLVDDVRARGGHVAFIALPPPGPSLGSVIAAGRPAGSAVSRVPGASYVAGYNAVLAQVATASGGAAVVVDINDVLCPEGTCAVVQDGTVVRYDGVHYTATYARKLVPVILARAQTALAR